ncbi:hypothetical protein LCGC14_3149340 [marine sediment metagenome]|uniref:Uncharacterized protein n=1 Tax=marine sediment metagenome TaxID=412755 RepID=A0A0F8WII2_9ZZZZ
MLKRWICRLWGHRTVYKAFTGDVVEVDNPMVGPLKTPVKHWARSPYCLRCGKDVPADAEGHREASPSV